MIDDSNKIEQTAKASETSATSQTATVLFGDATKKIGAILDDVMQNSNNNLDELTKGGQTSVMKLCEKMKPKELAEIIRNNTPNFKDEFPKEIISPLTTPTPNSPDNQNQNPQDPFDYISKILQQDSSVNATQAEGNQPKSQKPPTTLMEASQSPLDLQPLQQL